MGTEDKKTILVIDDEVNLAKLLKINLEDKGYSVLIANDGEEGLRKAKEGTADLIILDLKLPKLPGEELCKEIRKDDKIKDTPIIMLTAKDLDVDRVIGRVVGADRYLTKPFEHDELVKEIDKLLFGGKKG